MLEIESFRQGRRTEGQSYIGLLEGAKDQQPDEHNYADSQNEKRELFGSQAVSRVGFGYHPESSFQYKARFDNGSTVVARR